MMGVAPSASILSVRVTLEPNDPLLADANVAAGLPAAIARGIRYAVNHHATVIDLPPDPVTVPGSPGVGGSSAEKAAVAYALAHHVVLVAPAGDEGAGTDPVNFPASYKGVISVGAFDSQFSKAAFSSHQPYVTLTGAGAGVIAANGRAGYAQISSTAAASAVVAGIVALIRAQFPALSPAQVTKALTESARFQHPGGQQDGSGAGTVDAARALAAAARMVEAVPSAGSSPVAGAPGAQPPGAPAVHASSDLSRTLLIDIGIAVAIFLLLAVPILTYGLRRRRRARAARLAEVRAAAQPVPPRKPAPTQHTAIDTVEPDQYNYIPAPPNQPLPAAAPRSAAFPPAASPPVPSAGPSSPAASSPAMGARMGTNGTGGGAHPPWALWGSENGTPASGPPRARHPRERVPRARGPGPPDQPTRAASGPARLRRPVDARWPGCADRPGGPGWAGRPDRAGRAARRGRAPQEGHRAGRGGRAGGSGRPRPGGALARGTGRRRHSGLEHPGRGHRGRPGGPGHRGGTAQRRAAAGRLTRTKSHWRTALGASPGAGRRSTMGPVTHAAGGWRADVSHGPAAGGGTDARDPSFQAAEAHFGAGAAVLGRDRGGGVAGRAEGAQATGRVLA